MEIYFLIHESGLRIAPEGYYQRFQKTFSFKNKFVKHPESVVSYQSSIILFVLRFIVLKLLEGILNLCIKEQVSTLIGAYWVFIQNHTVMESRVLDP